MFKKTRLFLLAMSVTLIFQTSCIDEIAPGNYYTFTGETVGGFLENREPDFSSFITILKRANVWSELKTYGTYTCLAPTNEAIQIFLDDKGYSSIDLLTDKECDTIASTHLIDQIYYTTDMVEGSFPSTNRLDRYLTFSCDSDTLNSNKIIYYINKTARMVERDDSVQNGVVQIVDRVVQPSSSFLPDLIKEDSTVSLFYSALVLTRMCDSLIAYKDEKYVAPGGDSCTTGVRYHTGNEYEYAIFPENRYFKFSAFIEPNKVYREAGIYNLDDLIAYAKNVYDISYPEDAGQFDDDFTHRKNPLNRFVSYHLLEYYGGYSDWNVTNNEILSNNFKRTEWDVEDFFETMMPRSILRICTPSVASPKGIYINRKGTPKKVIYSGIRMWAPSESAIEQNALNGIYHYIDGILKYDYNTRYNVLNTRIRFDCTTMSPDFVNSGGRNRPGVTDCTGMKQGFTKNWEFSRETLVSVRNRHEYFYSYQGDEIILQGIYDATVKLPPVPFNGTYEIRIGYPVMSSRGVIQAYFDGMPCDIPTDLRTSGPNPKVGWVSDDGLTQEQIRTSDKSMRNRGYMKGIASYGAHGAWFRDQSSMLRRILTTQYMEANGEYYLRVRQILDNSNAEMVYDYLELVPKSVYASDQGEDIW